MDADKYKYRYRAVVEYANGAMFNVGELESWGISTKIPISFEKLFGKSDQGDDYDAAHHFIFYEILSHTISWNLVPATPTKKTRNTAQSSPRLRHADEFSGAAS
jgi:hypothetical protein